MTRTSLQVVNQHADKKIETPYCFQHFCSYWNKHSAFCEITALATVFVKILV